MNRYYQREEILYADPLAAKAERDFRQGDLKSATANFLAAAALYAATALEVDPKNTYTKLDLAESAVHCCVFAARKDLALSFIDKITEGDQSMLRSELIKEFKKSDERSEMLGKEVS